MLTTYTAIYVKNFKLHIYCCMYVIRGQIVTKNKPNMDTLYLVMESLGK